MREHVARFVGARRINCRVAFLDVSDDPLFVYHERRAIAVALLFIKRAVIFHHGAFEVAQEREGEADVLREAFVGRNTVHTNAENLRVGSFEFGDISLIRLQLLRSTTPEGENIKCKHDVLLAFEVAELDFFTGRAWKCKVGRRLAHLELRFWRSGLLRVGANRQQREHGREDQGFLYHLWLSLNKAIATSLRRWYSPSRCCDSREQVISGFRGLPRRSASGLDLTLSCLTAGASARVTHGESLPHLLVFEHPSLL